jgi:hypothetical protein
MVFVRKDLGKDSLSTRCGATGACGKDIYIQSADRQVRLSGGDIGCDGRE